MSVYSSDIVCNWIQNLFVECGKYPNLVFVVVVITLKIFSINF